MITHSTLLIDVVLVSHDLSLLLIVMKDLYDILIKMFQITVARPVCWWHLGGLSRGILFHDTSPKISEMILIRALSFHRSDLRFIPDRRQQYQGRLHTDDLPVVNGMVIVQAVNELCYRVYLGVIQIQRSRGSRP